MQELFVNEPIHEFYSRNKWLCEKGDLAGVELRQMPSAALHPDKGWILLKDSKGMPVGITEYSSGNPAYIKGDFAEMVKPVELPVADIDSDGKYIGQHTIWELAKKLTPEESEWAKQKFVDLMLKEQKAKLADRERLAEIKGGDYD